MKTNETSELERLYRNHFNETFDSIETLPATGSYRKYFRIKKGNTQVLGVINSDLKENLAYISFSQTFINKGINVPKILAVNTDKTCYLVDDLGETTLYTLTHIEKKNDGRLKASAIEIYKKTLDALFKLQTTTIEAIDLKLCYPRDRFDFQSMIWDLYYFKYYALRLFRINFDEQALEDDMLSLAKKLDTEDKNAFLYRDFQSRNILIKNNTPYFIDFQGGRKGAIYYDVASLLFDANIALHPSDITILSSYYKDICANNNVNTTHFEEKLYAFAAIRLMQALGAFGLRGVVEKKPGFIECIPYAINTLNTIFPKSGLNIQYPEINASIEALKNSSFVKKIINNDDF